MGGGGAYLSPKGFPYQMGQHTSSLNARTTPKIWAFFVFGVWLSGHIGVWMSSHRELSAYRAQIAENFQGEDRNCLGRFPRGFLGKIS